MGWAGRHLRRQHLLDRRGRAGDPGLAEPVRRGKWARRVVPASQVRASNSVLPVFGIVSRVCSAPPAAPPRCLEDNKLDHYYDEQCTQLLGLVDLVRGDLSKLARRTLTALVARDQKTTDVCKSSVYIFYMKHSGRKTVICQKARGAIISEQAQTTKYQTPAFFSSEGHMALD